MDTAPTIPLLKNSPLVEVVFGIQVTTPANLQEEDVRGEFEPRIISGLFLKETGHVFNPIALFDKKSLVWNGMKLESHDKRLLGHFLRNGMYINFLPPYGGYQGSILRVKELWEAYRLNFKPENILGTSIRYINIFDIPLVNQGFKADEWFRMISLFPHPSPFELISFHNQRLVGERENGLQGRISLTSLEEKQGMLKVSLDIEGFRPRITAIDSLEPWVDFIRLREWTYRMFTEILTPTCLEPFK